MAASERGLGRLCGSRRFVEAADFLARQITALTQSVRDRLDRGAVAHDQLAGPFIELRQILIDLVPKSGIQPEKIQNVIRSGQVGE
jgi:hypothetical protein